MTVFKILRIVLVSILSFVVIVTSIFIADRYIYHPHTKGISPEDIQQILIYLVVPLIVLIVAIRFIEKKRKRNTPR